MIFTRAMDTVALCGPSRAALLTGVHSHVNGFDRNEAKDFDGSQLTFPKVLQEAGYQTAIFGKWHLGSQPTGFDHYELIPGHGQFWDCPFKKSGQAWEEETVCPGYLTEVITERTLDWLEQQDSAQPFCAMVHHKAPHTPHEYPERYERLYQEDFPEPDTFQDSWDGRHALKQSLGKWSKFEEMVEHDLWGNESRGKVMPDRTDKAAFKSWAYQVFKKGYLRLVSSLDDSVGQILDYLDRSGLAETTLVIYTSDNGFFLGEHGIYNKMWMYDQALRLPMVIRWPGKIESGSTCEDLISLIDLAPTFCQLAAGRIPTRFQGASLTSVFEGEPLERDVHYYHYRDQFDVPDHCGITTKTHKLICFYHSQDLPTVWEFYDLVHDPMEMHNLAATKPPEDFRHYAEILRSEAARLEDPVAGELQILTNAIP